MFQLLKQQAKVYYVTLYCYVHVYVTSVNLSMLVYVLPIYAAVNGAVLVCVSLSIFMYVLFSKMNHINYQMQHNFK